MTACRPSDRSKVTSVGRLTSFQLNQQSIFDLEDDPQNSSKFKVSFIVNSKIFVNKKRNRNYVCFRPTVQQVEDDHFKIKNKISDSVLRGPGWRYVS